MNRYYRIFLELFRYGCTCAAVLTCKLACTYTFELLVSPYAAYFVAHTIVFFVSYYLHSKVSFASRMSLAGLRSYFFTVIGFKLLDYGIFSVALRYSELDTVGSVILATITITIIRFVVVRKVLKTEGAHHAR